MENPKKVNLSIQTRAQMRAEMENDKLIEETVKELAYRQNLKLLRGRRHPIPFMRSDHHRPTPEYARELRLSMGLNQGPFAKLLGVGASFYNYYERGKAEMDEVHEQSLARLGAEYGRTGIVPEIPTETFKGGGRYPDIRKKEKPAEAVEPAAPSTTPLAFAMGLGTGFLLAAAIRLIEMF
jgi:transcriptional regulator with XRE-family HTH domain